MTVESASPPALRAVLLQRVQGIGPDRAAALVAAFGDGLPEVFAAEDGVERLAAILAPDRPALSRRLAATLAGRWEQEIGPEFAAMAWLDRHGITDQPGLARSIVRALGPRTEETLSSNPYVLAKTLPWPRMDAVGLRALGVRMGADSAVRAPQRLLGAIDSAVGEALARGHTAAGKETMEKMLRDRLGSAPEPLAEALRLAGRHGRLAASGRLWRFPGCAFMEARVAERLAAMRLESGAVAVDPEQARRAAAYASNLLPRPLADEQREAVVHALLHPFAVITGGAGTGKTATMQALVLAWEHLGGRAHLCALAGKAALRLSQATMRPAMTLHRTLLDLARRKAAGENGTAPDPKLSWLDDATMVVVDEASMVDLGQWARLLAAMPTGCRLVMAGDPAQLPPIGFGIVFHLLTDSPEAARLTKIHRQASDNGIPEVAAAVRRRALPTLPAFAGPSDGVSAALCPESGIDAEIERVVGAMGRFGATGLDLHVVAATNRRVAALNQRFHDLRRDGRPEVRSPLGPRFSMRDPVVFTENDYARGLFNGLIGSILRVDPLARTVEVSFDGKVHLLLRDDLIRLDLAYAMTCHRLQGSQAPRVIVALDSSRLIESSWLYTAITRAERQAVVVGPVEAMAAAVSRPTAWTERCVGFSGHSERHP